MAKDCLVTKLKSVVSNDSLAKIGELTIKVLPYSGDKQNILINSPEAITLRTSGNFCTYEGSVLGNTIAIEANTPTFIYLTEDGGDVFLPCKYGSLARLSINMETLPIQTADLKLMSIYDFKANVQGEVKDLPDFIEGDFPNAAGLTGNIADFVSFANASSIILDGTSVVGTCESYVEALFTSVSGGTKNVTIRPSINNTFNSVYVIPIKVEIANNRAFVKDKNDNVLGTYDGATWSYS